MVLSCIVSEIRRFIGRNIAKIARLYPPQSQKSPSLGVTPIEFRDEPDISAFRLSDGEEIMTFLRFDTIPECDRRTDGQTDRRTDGHLCSGYTSACIACYANALVKTSNISETVEDRAKVNINGLYISSRTRPVSYILAPIKSPCNMGFQLPLKCMTLNDLYARFKVIDSLNTTKMPKYSLGMTPTPCTVTFASTSTAECALNLVHQNSILSTWRQLRAMCLETLSDGLSH